VSRELTTLDKRFFQGSDVRGQDLRVRVDHELRCGRRPAEIERVPLTGDDGFGSKDSPALTSSNRSGRLAL
jgi:hypothetical protein